MANEVLTEWERLRAAADNADGDVLERLARVYAAGYRDISPAVNALIEKMESDLKSGAITAAQVRNSAAFRALLRDIRRELDDFSAYLRTEIKANATDATTRGALDGHSLIVAAVAAALGVKPKDVHADVIIPVNAPDTLDFLQDYLNPDGPLFERIATLSQYWEQQIADGILENVSKGWNPRKIGEWITDEYGLGLTDSLRMTRTVQLYSYRQSNNAAQIANADLLQGVVWCAELDDRVCMSCVSMHGRVFPVGTVANDHHNGRAEMPGNVILSDDTAALETIWHDGEIIVIHAASGKQLAVTPNHPVLTQRGWVAAQFIQRGDNVISTGRADWASLDVRPDNNYMPSRVENIPQALGMFRLGSVPETAENFYRNGPDGQINTVFIDRLLWDSMDAASREQIKQRFFGPGHPGVFLPGLRRFYERFEPYWYAASRILSGLNPGFQLVRCHSGSNNPIGFGLPASGYSVFGENTGNNRARNFIPRSKGRLGAPRFILPANMGNFGNGKSDFVPGIFGEFSALNQRTFGFTPKQPLSLENIRQSLRASMPTTGGSFDAITSQVVFDSVVDIGVRAFRGHVYSLQSRKEWYYSNGIISHNCAMLPWVKGTPNPVDQNGLDWFADQSPTTQSSMLGPEKYAAWQDGKIALNESLSKTYNDDVYGEMRREASLKDLLND